MTTLTIKRKYNTQIRLYSQMPVNEKEDLVIDLDFASIDLSKKFVKAEESKTIYYIYVSLSRIPENNTAGYPQIIRAKLWMDELLRVLKKAPSKNIYKIYYITSFGKTVMGHTQEQMDKLRDLAELVSKVSSSFKGYEETNPTMTKSLKEIIISLETKLHSMTRNRTHNDPKNPIINKDNFTQITDLMLKSTNFDPYARSKFEYHHFGFENTLVDTEDKASFIFCNFKELNTKKLAFEGNRALREKAKAKVTDATKADTATTVNAEDKTTSKTKKSKKDKKNNTKATDNNNTSKGDQVPKANNTDKNSSNIDQVITQTPVVVLNPVETIPKPSNSKQNSNKTL